MPPGQFEDDEQVIKSDHEKLLGVVATLGNNNRVLEERVVELRMSHLDLENNFGALRLSTNAKLKRVAKVMGREDLLLPPSP